MPRPTPVPARVHLANLKLEHSPYNAPTRIIDARAGIVALEPRRTKVALVGAGNGRQYAPLLDDTYEVWALNAIPPRDQYGRLRADRWFEMHIREPQSDDDMRWIKACPFPLYIPPVWAERELSMPPERREVPNAVRYPLEAIENHFQTSYWACSFAYQIALALKEGFTDIGLFGVELAYGTYRERTVEWACVSYWMGLARGQGAAFHLPPNTRLGCHDYRYGIEYYEEKRAVEAYVKAMRDSDKARTFAEFEDESVGG